MAAMRSADEGYPDQANKEILFGVYEEDVIQSRDKKKLGIVVRAYDDSDGSDDSDEDEDEEDEKLEKGKVMIGWYSAHPKWSDKDVEVVDENNVELVDRSLLPGDVIRWIDKSKGNQKGHIKHVKVSTDLLIVGTNHVIRNVDAKKLLPLSAFSCMNSIVSGPWLGTVREVTFSLTLVLKNKARCVIIGDETSNLVDITDQREEETTFYCSDFYPGQQVQGPPRVFKEAKYLSGTKPILGNQRIVKAIVESVTISELDVDWHVSGYSGSSEESSLQQPPMILKGNQLTNGDIHVLNHFKEAHTQIGDKAFYILSQQDVDKLTKKETKHQKAEASKNSTDGETEEVDENEEEIDDENNEDGDSDYGSESTPDLPQATPIAIASNSGRRGGARSRNRRRLAYLQKRHMKKRYRPPVVLEAGKKVCVEVCKTYTITDAQWQDGKFTENVPSISFHPVMHLDELEFFPGDFVIDKRENTNEGAGKFGVIQKADFEGRICSVRWLQFLNNATETTEELEENISVYDIAEHTDYTFRPGDTVVRLSTEDTNTEEGKQEINRLASVGQVLQVLINGHIDVLWVDETTSKVLPSQLYVIKEDEDNEWDSSDDDYDESDMSVDGAGDDDEWETSSEASDVPADLSNQMSPLEDIIRRSLAALNPPASNENTPVNTNIRDVTQQNETPMEESDQHVIGMNRRTVEFVNALERHFKPGGEDDEEEKEEDDVVARETVERNKDESMEDVQEKSSFQSVEYADESHNFFNTVCLPTNQRQFNTAIMKDIKLMRTHLPNGIIVKAFQDRIDLLSVLIAGPAGTPYEDGLFLFDLKLSDNYPASPPEVHYHSFCSQRLNPNLYEEGKVCISLLGTWSGKGNETWTSKSSVHQVLLSIQGLILCAEPYFNEAGFEKQRGTVEGIENSRMYNEMAIIKMLESVANIISRPPPIFKEEIRDHFIKRLPKLVSRIENWMTSSNENSIPQFPLLPLSKGFCVTVQRQLDRLKVILQKPPFS